MKQGANTKPNRFNEEFQALQQRVVQLERSEYERERAQQAIDAIVAGLSTSTGKEFFDSLVLQFARILKADFTLIGEYNAGDKETVSTLSFSMGEEIQRNFVYDLKGTPCANVMGRDICTYPSGVAELFPEDILLMDMGIQGYVGVPLFDTDGKGTGIIVALYQEKVEDPKFAESIMRIFAYRASAELQRKQSEEAMRRLQNLLSNIVNSMPSILIGVDRQGRVTQWNREAEKRIGIPALEAFNRELPQLFPQLKDEMKRVHDAIRCRKPHRDEKISIEINGEFCFSDITVYPLVTNGIEGAVILIDDITDRVRIEEIMIQSEKMVSVGGLAAGMAHEINNPLAGILQNAQVMNHRLDTQLPRNQRAAEQCGTSIEALKAYMVQRGILDMLDSIIDSGRRAAGIVQNMLGFSRKSESRSAPCNLAELLDSTIELAYNDYDLKKKYDFRKINIIRNYSPETPLIAGESTKLQQVFLNLLKNGAQAMAESCQDRQPCFTLTVEPENGNTSGVEWVRVLICDNGPGMDEPMQRRIFEPFFTTKENGVGTGLGLSVSYFIISKNHNGTLTVQSAPGKGSTFIIRVPVQQE